MRHVIWLWFVTHHQRWLETIAAMLTLLILITACEGGGDGDDWPDDGMPKGSAIAPAERSRADG